MERGGLAKVKQYPLGDDDIHKLLGDVSIHTYPQLKEMSSIDQAFDDQGRSILLFPNASPTMGHWCCMIKKPRGIEFFDPYGDAPEEQKDGLSKSRLEQLDIEHPDLTTLLRASGKPVFYNNFAFQKDKPSIATCGRHCVSRLMMSPLSLDQYKAVIDKSGLAPDDFVAGLTYDKLRK
jgi:hypothetical protein